VNKKELIIGAVVASLLIILGVIKVITRPPEPEKPPVVANTVKQVDYGSAEHVSMVQTVREKKAAEGREKARTAIQEHEEAIVKDWASPYTPDRMMAVGNLYQYKLEEYDSAIQRYAAITDEYPRYSGTPQAYVEMAKCYERKGDQVQANYVYREMIDKLNPASQHVAYAKQQLGEE
jgi:hypothetical protein